MSQDFKAVLVKDDRLMTGDEINFAVYKGGQNNTIQPYPAISPNVNSCTFNCPVPSLETIMDREVLIKADLEFTITGTPAVGDYLVDYGKTDAFSPFPLQQLTTTISATINSTTVTINTRDVLPQIMRFHDKRQLMRYNGMTPVMFDTYQNYADALEKANNPLGAYGQTSDNDLMPRGAFAINSITGNTVGDGATAKTVVINVTVTEPLIVSPFLFAHPSSNNGGLYGVSNLTLLLNFGNAARAWRTATPSPNYNVQFSNITNAQLLINYLTPHPSDLLPSRCVVPYLDIPRFITSGVISLNDGATGDLQTNSFQMNRIPDSIIVVARKPMGSQTYTDTDSFLPINSISVQFNNQSGILASATQQNLYKMSVQSGVNQTWQEWSGRACAGGVNGNDGTVKTTGSVLALKFGEHIQLTEDYLAPSSIGQFNFQIKLNVTNNTGAALIPEVCIIPVYSGVFVTEKGTSQTFLGLLDKQTVLDASAQAPYASSDVERMIGGGFFDSIKSAVKGLAPKLPSLAKEALKHVDNKYAKAGVSALESLGYAKPRSRLDKHLM